MKKINNMTVFEPTDKCSLDEYSQKAAIEVPELIKKAKEEVNQKVIEISENDIKQDNEILELKTNYTNLQEQNTKLESQIKKDRENMINLEVEGQSVHIEDSSDLEGQLEVLGNVEQKTNLYTGKLEQGTINAEGEVSTANRVRTVDFIKVTAGIKIPVRATGADKFAFATYDNNKKFTSIIGTWTNVGESIAIPSNVNYIKIILGKNNDSNIAVSDITNFVVGNLPSPEYPSEIRAVGDKGSVEIKKQNKNLLKNTAKTQTVNGVTFTVNEDGTVIANGTAVAEASLTINNQINLEKGGYCISGCPKGGGNNTYRIGLWNNAWESIALDLGDSNNFVLQQDTEAIKCAINIKQGTIVNNAVFKPKLEEGTVKTEYVEHQEQTKILPIQKPMLEGDYFIKETDSWKEVHNWGKKVFDGTENWDAYEDTQPNAIGFGYNYQDGQKNFVGLSNYFIPYNTDYMPGRLGKDIEGLVIRYNYIKISRFKREIPNVESLKKWLKEIYDLGKPLYVYYKLETPTKLPCTPEQTKVLDELDNFQTYKPVTNITTDSIAKIKLKYIADTKTYVDNKTSNLEQQVSVINQLLSTTKTSSILLDNLQKDIESEVL